MIYMGEQLVIPQLREYQPLSDTELMDRLFHLTTAGNEIIESLNNPSGLILESVHELQQALAEVDRRIEGLSVTAIERGLMSEPHKEAV